MSTGDPFDGLTGEQRRRAEDTYALKTALQDFMKRERVHEKYDEQIIVAAHCLLLADSVGFVYEHKIRDLELLKSELFLYLNGAIDATIQVIEQDLSKPKN